ncbi:MAG: pentapeptide repeat-containing protein [Leptolyngbya sp. SIO1D8]|nr:pentapeptide repeat-containing protein [Leptolyngbya sp. SIO1D8]
MARIHLRRILGSKFFRTSAVVTIACSIAIWISDENPTTSKEWAKVLFDNAEPIAIASASALGQTGSGGRIQALEDLNKDGVDLEGVATPQADLSGIHLDYGKLSCANLEKTQLDQANLSSANLSGANLHEAKLCQTKLPNYIKLNPDRNCWIMNNS